MSISERGIGEVTTQPSPPPNSEPPAQCGCGSLSELSEAVRGRPEAERGNLIMLIRHAPRVTVHGMGRNQRDYTPASDEGLGQARTEIVGADLPSVALVAIFRRGDVAYRVVFDTHRQRHFPSRLLPQDVRGEFMDQGVEVQGVGF